MTEYTKKVYMDGVFVKGEVYRDGSLVQSWVKFPMFETAKRYGKLLSKMAKKCDEHISVLKEGEILSEPKFQRGDRFRVTANHYDERLHNLCGTVVELPDKHDCTMYRVRYDNGTLDINHGHYMERLPRSVKDITPFHQQTEGNIVEVVV